MDDTLIRKRGHKVYGAAWRRDPLGPAFNTNFVWGQRFQTSAALPDTVVAGQARAIPIGFTHAPIPAKPGKKATDEQWAEYRAKKKSTKLPYVGAQGLGRLRERLDKDRQLKRRIIVAVDGSFTDRTFCRACHTIQRQLGESARTTVFIFHRPKELEPGDADFTEIPCPHPSKSGKMNRFRGSKSGHLQRKKSSFLKLRPLRL